MSYGTTVHNNSVMKLKEIQLEAGRIVSGATKLVEIDTLQRAWMAETLWEKGSSQTCLVLTNESWFIASLLSNFLPLHVGELSTYRLRYAENYVGIYANTRAYAQSFLP